MVKMRKLSAYMKKRAAFEGVKWQLTDAFLKKNFDCGVRLFFGVSVNERGDLLSDEQQPDFFNDCNGMQPN